MARKIARYRSKAGEGVELKMPERTPPKRRATGGIPREITTRGLPAPPQKREWRAPGPVPKPTLQEAPKRPPPKRPLPPRTGGIPPAIDLSHLTGQKMPKRRATGGIPRVTTQKGLPVPPKTGGRVPPTIKWIEDLVMKGKATNLDITKYERLLADIMAGKKTNLDITKFEKDLLRRGTRPYR